MNNKKTITIFLFSFILVVMLSLKLIVLQIEYTEKIVYAFSFVIITLFVIGAVSIVLTGLFLQVANILNKGNQKIIWIKNKLWIPTVYVLWYFTWLTYVSFANNVQLMSMNVIISSGLIIFPYSIKSSEVLFIRKKNTAFLAEDYSIRQVEIVNIKNDDVSFFELDNPDEIIIKSISQL